MRELNDEKEWREVLSSEPAMAVEFINSLKFGEENERALQVQVSKYYSMNGREVHEASPHPE